MKLTLSGLTLAYPGQPPVLNGIDLQIESGETVALMGANGSGKTSLLLALVGILPASGTIRLDSTALSKKTATFFRQHIGMVFQNPDDQLFSPSIWEDVAFGLENMSLPEDEIRDRVDTLLHELGLAHLKDRTPHDLSGGEKKIAALATVLVMKPDLIMLDEPTAFLDMRARKRLENALRDIPQAMLITTHDARFAARMCRRAVLLDSGKVAADGETETLLRDKALTERCGVDALE